MYYSFKNDYSEGAHPKVMEALLQTNLEQTDGYGCDRHTESAVQRIKDHVGRQDAQVHLLVGGTQTNLTLIASALRPYQAVISAETGHICVHETGAIESTGHKVIAMPSADGKLTPELIAKAVKGHTDEHMVQPRMVYLSHPSELGTVYSKAELQAIRSECDAHGLYLFLDGARLASALTCGQTDVTLRDLAAYTDAFYIGGTKCGALFGEALVLLNDALKPDFRYMIKQRGGLLAKGRLLGVQFERLFTDDLYAQLGAHSNRMAAILRDALHAAGIPMLADSPTNQLFPILPTAWVETLAPDFGFEVMEQMGEQTAIRLVTSWATVPEQAERFAKTIAELHGRG